MNTGLIEELNRIKETQIALREHISHAIKGIEQLEEIKKQKELAGDTESVAKINETLNQVKPLLAQISDLAQENTISNQEFMQITVYIDLISRVLVTILFTVLWGMGPVTCGFTYVLRNYAREEHSWLFSDFF